MRTADRSTARRAGRRPMAAFSACRTCSWFSACSIPANAHTTAPPAGVVRIMMSGVGPARCARPS